jgi:putative hemolysin
MSTYVLEIIGILVLVMVGGFFAAAEIALISASRPLLRRRAQEGEAGARIALKLLEDPSRLLAAVQVGMTLVGFLASAVAAVSLADAVAKWLVSLGVPAGVAAAAAVFATTAAVSYVSLVFGELTPKRLGLQRAESVSVAVARPISWVAAFAAPLTWVLARSADLVGRLLGLHAGGKPGVTEEELKLLVTEQGTLLDEEKRMIAEVFELGDTAAREIMVPRVDMVMLEDDTPLRRALEVFQGTGFSRLPVFHEDRDQIVGILLLKDSLPCFVDGRECRSLAELVRPAVFVPETKRIVDLLSEMQATHNQIAIVVDEHGGTEGLVTLEDIIEEVVGEVSDEYDRVQRFVQELGPGDWLVDGRLPVEDARHELGLEMPQDDQYETLAGWVLSELGHIPEPGETFEHDDFTIRVANVRRRRIARLRVTLGTGSPGRAGRSIDADETDRDEGSENE